MAIDDVVRRAWEVGTVVLAFNVPYLPMLEPIVRAVRDQDSFALIETARIEWLTFECYGPAAVQEAFARHGDPDHVRLHLDHVPVVDEDGLEVDYLPIIRKALDLGYPSVMIDGSRVALEDNIAITRLVAAMAHQAGALCEAELGAILREGHGPLPPYEELFASGKGFTDVDQAARFVAETGCDWLSVAIGNIHGAVSKAFRNRKKVEARLNLDHLRRLKEATGIPLVLHGGSGVKREYVLAAIQHGIAKINVATAVRQAYEEGLRRHGTLDGAKDAVYERTVYLIRDYFEIAGSRSLVVA
ncbi:MAG TPA: class II fructose-bisphosphate aldolase [Chloroflexi bacterium]|nr:class II fructose-bisphosphate aldolase [Chloroflexota bacterium]